MPLDHSMMSSAVRIIGDVEDPPNRRTLLGYHRGAIGTGFLVSVPSVSIEGQFYTYLLTAHHVLDCQTKVEVQVPNPLVSGQLHPPRLVTDWRQPIDKLDLAVAPFASRDYSHGRVYAQASLFTDQHFLAPRRVAPLGATVHYIGILTPLDRPMVRSGTVGAVLQEGLEHDKGYEYEATLIDCRSYAGFSGSPCFLASPVASLTPIDNAEYVRRGAEDKPRGTLEYWSLLCGMFTQHLDDNSGYVVSRYGVGVMLPSHLIWRALMTPKMQEERKEWDEVNKQASKDSDGPRLTNTSVDAHSADETEYERFEALTSELLRTPKQTDEKDKPSQ